MNLERVLSYLNEQLTAGLTDPRFAGVTLWGMAETVFSENNVQGEPCAFNKDKEFVYCGQDDSRPLNIYYKVLSATNSINAAKAVKGEGFNSKQYTISAFVDARRSKVKMYASDLDTFIFSKFPKQLPHKQLSDFKLQSCNLNYVSTNYNTVAILQQEYKGKNILPDDELILFETRFTVDCQFNTNCIETLCC